MLSETQVASFRENGYLAIENVLSASELAELRTLTDDFVEQSREVSTNTQVFDLEPGHSAESPQVRRIKHPVKHHPTYRKYASHEDPGHRRVSARSQPALPQQQIEHEEP